MEKGERFWGTLQDSIVSRKYFFHVIRKGERFWGTFEDSVVAAKQSS